MLVSVTGDGEINPAPAEAHFQQHFNSFSRKSHLAFAHVGGGKREGRDGSAHCASGDDGHSVNQPLLAWGATVLLALPSSPPQLYSPCLCVAGWVKIQPVAL